MKKKLLNLLFLTSLSSSAHATEIIDIPSQGNVRQLEHMVNYFSLDIDDVIKGAQQELHARNWCQEVPDWYRPIKYLTPQEAKKILGSYVEQKIGKQACEELEYILFTNRYFGVTPQVEWDDTYTIAKEDPYLFTHLTSMLNEGRPGVEGTMENAKKRWGPKIHFLTPQQVFEAYVNHPHYKKNVSVHKFETFKETNPEKTETIFSSRYFGIPQEENERQAFYATHPLGFFTHDMVKEVYDGALKILNHTEKGDNIVIFGNSPYFVGRALKLMIQEDTASKLHRNLIELPFSGSPNRIREGSFPDMRNIVTEAGLQHLKKRLAGLGLSANNPSFLEKTTHFVDVISSGSGVAYVMEEILREVQEKKLPTPHLNIFTINKVNVDDQEDFRQSKIAYKSADDGEEVEFYFPSKDNARFKVPARVAYVKCHSTLDMLPNNDWRIFPEYNAAYWQDEYNWMLKKEDPLHIKYLKEFFDFNVKKLIAE